jgi:hypothetical protein
MFRFNKIYFLIFLMLLWFEVLIALFMQGNFIRIYVGDFLVVILIYCFIRSFIEIGTFPSVLATLLFAYTVEWAQYFSVVNRLGLQDNRIATTLMGNAFEWQDLLAYTLGGLIVMLIEYVRTHDGLLLRRSR